MMKKIISLFICVCFALPFLLCSCAPGAAEDSGKIKVTVSIFPLWDWTRQIIGQSDAIELNLLISDGTDMHSYQPSVADIVKITGSDLFIFVGGESDKWADDALKNDADSATAVFKAVDCMKDRLVDEEAAEGMQTNGHSHSEHGHDSGIEEEPEADEHVWLSLKNAEIICGAIAEKLSEIDGGNAGLYKKNAENYINQLIKLDGEFQSVVSAAKYKTLIFCDRFPFRYLTEDYQLEYYAAFPGCSSETDASFKTVVFLAEKLNQLNLPAVLTVDSGGTKLAQTVVSCADNAENIKILSLDSMQSVKFKNGQTDKTYLDAMRHNLEAITQCLG